MDAISAAARNVIGHYRAELADLPEQRRDEINSRWLEAILDLDQDRHPRPLDEPRDLPSRVAGCCRDHSLFVVGALRDAVSGGTVTQHRDPVLALRCTASWSDYGSRGPDSSGQRVLAAMVGATRRAFAAMVKAGLRAADDGKKLPSTT